MTAGPATRLHYAESGAPDARERLSALLDQLGLAPGFLGGELLSSPAQPGLYLLATRWATEPPPLALPPGVRAWTFTVELSRGAPG